MAHLIVCSAAHTFFDGFFPYLAEMIISRRTCVKHNDLWAWPISFRSFSPDLATILLKYGTSCCVHSTACTVLDEFFHILHKWSLAWEGMHIMTLTNICKVIQLWHCLFMEFIHVWHKYNLWVDSVSYIISRSIDQRSSSQGSFKFLQSGQGVS